MTASEYEGSFGGDENIPKLVVGKVVKLCEYNSKPLI